MVLLLRKLTGFVLSLALIFSFKIPAHAELAVSANSAILVHADTGQVLFEKNPDAHMLIASTTKIMTAIVVLEHCELDDVVKVDEMEFTAWHTPGHTPGSVCLLCGQYLFTGDTLFAGSVGRTDLPGGSTRQMNESLRKLAGLPIPEQAQVLPGHGDLSTFGEELKHNWYIKSACKQD